MQTNILGKAIRSAALASVLSLTAISAFASAPMAKVPAPGYYRFMLGDFEVTALSDGAVAMPVEELLQQPAEKTVAELHKAFLNTPLQIPDNAYLINTGERLILVDAGAGSLFGPTLGKLMSNLKASGYKPEEVDDIFLTHMHPDHVGGLSANGVIQFANAVVHAERHESDYWLSQKNMDAAPTAAKDFFEDAITSVDPYVQAEQFQPFDGRVELMPGVTSYPSVGHTVGHTSYMIESDGKKLLVVGDLIHVPAVQLDHPNVTIAFDAEPEAAAATRIEDFNQAATDRTLVAGAHLPFPGIGHLRATGKTYQWVPVNFTQMPAKQQKRH